MNNLYYVIGAAIVAMLYAFWKTNWINSQDEGSDRMKQLGANIADGAMAFLKAEYRILGVFVVTVAIVLFVGYSLKGEGTEMIAVSFIVGAFASGLAGFLGMRVATKANNKRSPNRTGFCIKSGFHGRFSYGFKRGWAWCSWAGWFIHNIFLSLWSL